MEEMFRAWGDNISRQRKALGLTQTQLAELCDVRQSTVVRWERGVIIPRDAHKIRIAKALARDVRDLFPLHRAA